MKKSGHGWVGVAIIAALCLTPGVARAQPGHRPEPTGVSPALLRAMERDLRLDEHAARRRLADEAAAAAVAAKLVPALGAAYAGSWFDAASGRLVVGITDPARAEQVRDEGATPAVRRHSYAELMSVKDRMDALAKATPEAAAGVSSWRVDPMSDSVVLTTATGAPRGALAAEADTRSGAVRFETGAGATVAAGDFVDGGEGILTGTRRCSVGFNARLTYEGLPGVSDPVVISAGHCSVGATTVSGYGNSDTVAFSLGRWWMVDLDHDWAIAGAIDTSYWHQGAWISLHTLADDVLNVHGTQQRPIGSSVCKSGITTHITCGYIRARDETVVQSDTGRTVVGLTRDTTCQEPGDSGGPHYTADVQAQGVSSTSAVRRDASGRQRCLEVFGEENRSWYVEIGYIQGYTGARVVTTG